MTDERTFDRLARAWLELGPDEAPDRVIAAVLQAAETMPQARRRLRWPIWRSFRMSRTPIFATVVAILVVLIGGGLFLSRSNTPPVVGGSPSPSTASPAASPAAASQVPTAIQYTWIGPKPTIAGMPPSNRFRFELTDQSLQFEDDSFSNQWFRSSASAPGTGQLRLVASGSDSGCHDQDEGIYTWSLSPGGVRLSVVKVSDACAPRSDALAGDWIRVACTNTGDACFGDLDGGTYPSQYFTPRLGAGAFWAPQWGALTYTVPAGWANSTDWPNSFSLTPSTDYAKEGPTGPSDGAIHEIDAYRLPVAAAQNAACSNAPAASVPGTVDGLIGYLAGLKGLTSTPPVTTRVDGHPAKWIDIRVASTWKATCPGLTAPAVALFYRDDPSINSYGVAISGAEKDRLIFVDLGGGAVTAIVIDSSDPAKFDALVADAMPIIASFKFQ
jgi:hypothetical protein